MQYALLKLMIHGLHSTQQLLTVHLLNYNFPVLLRNSYATAMHCEATSGLGNGGLVLEVALKPQLGSAQWLSSLAYYCFVQSFCKPRHLP